VCREYLNQAQEFLDGQRKELPDPNGIVSARFPLSTIRKARCSGEDGFRRDWPFIAAVFEDLDAPAEKRTERYFDQWYFASMTVMQLAGGRFLFDRSKGRQFFYLIYTGPHTKEGRHYLTRIIANPSPLSDVRLSRDKDAHYDCRRITLTTKSKDVVVLIWNRKRANSPRRGRTPSCLQLSFSNDN